MKEQRSLQRFFLVYCKDVFTTKDTKSTKFGVLIIWNLRVLRGEQNELNVTHYSHESLKNHILK